MLYKVTNKLKKVKKINSIYSPLRSYAVIHYPWNRTAYTPVATGTPPKVVMMNEMREFKKNMELQTNALQTAIHNELDKRGVGGDSYKSYTIL